MTESAADALEPLRRRGTGPRDATPWRIPVQLSAMPCRYARFVASVHQWEHSTGLPYPLVEVVRTNSTARSGTIDRGVPIVRLSTNPETRAHVHMNLFAPTRRSEPKECISCRSCEPNSGWQSGTIPRWWFSSRMNRSNCGSGQNDLRIA